MTTLGIAIESQAEAAPDRLAAPATSRDLSDTGFVFASCQYPAGIFDRLSAGASIHRLDAQLVSASKNPPINALLLLGDQIYADATYGILEPRNEEILYEQLHHQWRRAMYEGNIRRLANNNRLYVTPDDHELEDNWEPGKNRRSAEIKSKALGAFAKIRSDQRPRGSPKDGYWGEVDVGGGHQVFMLDARTTRDIRPWGPGAAATPHIISETQRTELERWLRERACKDGKGPITPKFISSSVWLLPRRVGRSGGPDGAAAALSDSWDGYPESQRWLLGFITKNSIQGVVMLCGDAHLAGHTTVDMQTDHLHNTLHILHAPALYAPFPFANGQPHEYRCVDEFSWMAATNRFVCQVESKLRPIGDGFVRVSAMLINNAWQISATFDTGRVSEPPEVWSVS